MIERRPYTAPEATMLTKPRPSLVRVEELCAKHNGTCTQPCDACDLAGEVAALLRLLQMFAESEPTQPTPPAAEPYECIHAEGDRPHTLVVTCESVAPSRAELRERSELCAVCAGRVILLLQQLTERTHG